MPRRLRIWLAKRIRGDVGKAYKAGANIFLHVTYNTCRKWPYLVSIFLYKKCKSGKAEIIQELKSKDYLAQRKGSSPNPHYKLNCVYRKNNVSCSFSESKDLLQRPMPYGNMEMIFFFLLLSYIIYFKFVTYPNFKGRHSLTRQ